jgi:hypothetical protein
MEQAKRRMPSGHRAEPYRSSDRSRRWSLGRSRDGRAVEQGLAVRSRRALLSGIALITFLGRKVPITVRWGWLRIGVGAVRDPQRAAQPGPSQRRQLPSPKRSDT